MTHVRPLQWVSMSTAVLACLWFATSLLDPFNIPKLAILVVGAAVLIGMLGGFWKQWAKRSEWPVWGGFALFVVGLSAAGVASNQNVYRTLWGTWSRNDGWLAYAALAVVGIAIAVAFRGRDTRLGLYTLMGVGIFEEGYALLQTTGHDPITWNNGYNAIIGTVGNPDFASALIGICGVAMAWVAIEASHHVALRIAGGVLSLLAAWLTHRSGSVQGTLSWGAGLAVIIAGWLWTREDSRLKRLFIPYVVLAGLGALTAIIGMTDRGPFKSFMYKQNLVNRTYYWRAGWNMFKSHPVFGVGLDSFGDYYRIYRLPEQVAATGIQTTSNAAHSVFFQMLATGGIALIGTYVLLQAVVVWRGVVALRRGEHVLLTSALLGAWLAFTLQGLFSIDQLGLTVWGWVLFGLVVGVSYAEPARAAASSKKRRSASDAASSARLGALVAGTVLGLVSVVFVSGPLSTDSTIRTVISYAYNTAQPDANTQALIKQAVLDAAAGAQDPYWRAQAVSKLYAINDVSDGITLAEQSARMFPMDVTLWNLTAIAFEQTGRAKLAVPWRQHTVELDPLNTEFAKLLAQDQAAK